MNESKSLYSKYRPSSFKDVLGQDHITNVLKESIKLGNISHAYLFYGGRGTGKTSVARIFANEIKTHPDDLFEIDAASNTSVDDIRALNDAVYVMPFHSKYKVYILDEVHMLSKSAFNALLKTLEEPPAHVIFILATTEIHKVPETIVSRCEFYTFKKPTQSLLTQMVLKTAKAEGVTLEPSAAELIALIGDSSFRDTHGTLQKVINASGDKKITVEEVEKVTGAPKADIVNSIIESLIESNIQKGLEAVSKAVEQNIDMNIFISMILMKLRFILLLRYSPSFLKNIESSVTSSDLEFIKLCSADKNLKINSNTLKVFLEAHSMIGKTYSPQIPIEIALFDLIK